MGKCDVCKRELRKLHTIDNLHVCSKHYSQYKKYRKFLDNNPRTTFDTNEIIVDKNVAKIQLYNRKQNIIGEAIIDIEDIPKVEKYKWRVKIGGTERSKCASVLTGNGSTTYTNSLHRHIMNCPQGLYVDHINGNRFDNRKCNLRICTNQENNFNVIKQKTNTSGYKGVWYDKSRNKWVSELKVNGRKIFIGRFINKNDAVYTRFYAELLIHKDFMVKEDKNVLKSMIGNIPNEDKLIQVVIKKIKLKALI